MPNWTYSDRSNARRAAERAIAAGTAPAIDYGVKPVGEKFEVVWKTGAPVETVKLEGEGGGEVEVTVPPATQAVVKAVIEAQQGEDGRWPGQVVEPYPAGSSVEARIAKKWRVGTIKRRVGNLYSVETPFGSGLLKPSQIRAVSGDAAAAAKPTAKPTRREGQPRGRKAATAPALAAGQLPEKPVIKSQANPGYQKRIDALAAMAERGDWAGVAAYEVKGVNTYAKMVTRYRDQLVAAYKAMDAGAERTVAAMTA